MIITLLLLLKCVELEFKGSRGDCTESHLCTSLPGCKQSLWSVRSVKMELEDNFCHYVTVKHLISGCLFDHSMQVGKCHLKYRGLFPSWDLLLVFKRNIHRRDYVCQKKKEKRGEGIRRFPCERSSETHQKLLKTILSSVYLIPIYFLSSLFRILGKIKRIVPLKFEFDR